MIWNETVECMDREQLRDLQSARLKKMAEYVYYNTPFYRKKFQEMGLEPGDIKSIDDITKLPFTNKLDLRDNYPFGLAAVPMSQIVRIHASSGTTGKPIRLWPVYWRLGRSRWCYEYWCQCDSYLQWKYAEADDADARLWYYHSLLYPQLRYVLRRGYEGVRISA